MHHLEADGSFFELIFIIYLTSTRCSKVFASPMSVTQYYLHDQ